jgi:hypothetical protein
MDDKEIRETIFDAIDRSLTGKHRTATYEWLTRQLAVADAVRELGLIDVDDLRVGLDRPGRFKG